MNGINEFSERILNANSIVIIPHVNPDGDTIGSSLALYSALKNMKKTSDFLIYDTIPETYKFLPYSNEFKKIDDFDFDKKYDLAIAVDVASKDRMIHAQNIFDNAKYTINIDHHVTNSDYANLNFNKKDASSAGEVVFEMFKKSEIEISKEIAVCLYTAILTDTGGFRFENTSKNVLNIAAELCEAGANPCDLYRIIYETKPKPQVLLNAIVVSKAVFLNNNKIAYTTVTNNDLQAVNATQEHTEGIAETLRSIGKVDIAFVLKETENRFTKVSFRSKNVDVSKIALKFDGGGHKFASGCTIKKPLNVALNKLIEEIEKQL